MPRAFQVGRTLLSSATSCALEGGIEVVRYLLTLPDVARTINDATVDGDTPLTLACSTPNFECVDMLLAAKADITAAQSVNDWQALHFLAACGNVIGLQSL